VRLVEINWDPSTSQLRQFGVLCAFVLPLVGWLWNIGESGLVVLLVIGTIIAMSSFFFPTATRYLFVGLTLAVAPIGMVVGEAAMLFLFLVVFLPIGLIFRLTGRDALRRSIDKGASTYWQSKQEPKRVSNYYRRY
jgi:hypothetical protein